MSKHIISSQHIRHKAILERRMDHLKSRISNSDVDLKHDTNELNSIRYALKIFNVFEAIIIREDLPKDIDKSINTIIMDNCPEDILGSLIKFRNEKKN